LFVALRAACADFNIDAVTGHLEIGIRAELPTKMRDGDSSIGPTRHGCRSQSIP
jgi:hypothetical protein